MHINSHYEPEIRLRDVFFELLYHWRSILIAAIVGALLLGGYQYYSIASVHSRGQKTEEEEQYEAAVQDYDRNLRSNQEKLRVNQTLMQQMHDYMTKSVLNNMNAATLLREDRAFLVSQKQTGENPLSATFQDPVDYVMGSYASSLSNGLDPDQMMALLGTSEKRYIEELVRLSTNIETNIMTLSIYAETDEKLKEISDFFVNRLLTVCAEPIQAVYPHEVVMISDTVNTGLSDAMQQAWIRNSTNIDTYQTAIDDAEEALAALEKQGRPVAPGMHLGRMAAIGFVLFAFLTVVIWSVKYLAGGRLHDGKEMSQRYGLFVFAEADHSRARRPGKGIDGLIEKWEFGKARKDAAAAGREAADLLAGAVKGGAALALVSTRSSDSIEQLKKTLAAELGGRVGQVVCLSDFPQTDGAKRLPEGAQLVIVEEKYESRNDRIRRAAEILAMQRADVLGSVVL